MVEPGDPVSPCTVVTNRCAGDDSVYWFRRDSDDSQSGLIYTQRQSSGQCETSFTANSPTQTCVYSLPKNITLSDGGMYYCAVAACEEILFGNKTKVTLKGKVLP